MIRQETDHPTPEANAARRPRRGRSAHQAVAQAQAHIADGHSWVVDLDLEKFFDRVSHDLLMGLPPGPLGPVPFSDRIDGLLAIDGRIAATPALNIALSNAELAALGLPSMAPRAA